MSASTRPGQAHEQLLLRMMASPLPETRGFATMILEELKKVMPSFVARVERPDRGGEWISYLERRRDAAERWVGRLGLDRREGSDAPSVELIDVDGSEDELIAASLFEASGLSERASSTRSAPCRRTNRRRSSPTWLGSAPTAATRRAAAGRPSATGSRSSRITAASGISSAIACSPASGSGSAPTSARGSRTRSGRRERRGIRARPRDLRAEYERLAAAGMPDAAPYALCLGYRIRYLLDLNAREAMHLIELRSGREGHPTYRAVAQAMHERIASVHPAIAAAMTHVDASTEPRLERIMSEIRTHRKRVAELEPEHSGRPAGRQRAGLVTPARHRGLAYDGPDEGSEGRCGLDAHPDRRVPRPRGLGGPGHGDGDYP